MNYGRKAAFSLIVAAGMLVLLGLMISKAKWGMPEHYEAPWWKFMVTIGFLIGFTANGLARFGEWYYWREVQKRR